MRIVTAQELENWLTSGKVLEKDARGPKVVALDNNLFLKIFHTRKPPLLARLRPAARRFLNNARLLNGLGVATPTITDIFWLEKDKGLSGCLYRPLPGISLEALFQRTPEALQAALPDLARFIHTLHRKHIYFRSLHLGNILLLPEGGFGLIDFLDLKRNLLPLTDWHVRRNFRHMENYLSRNGMNDFPVERLLALYGNLGDNALDQPPSAASPPEQHLPVLPQDQCQGGGKPGNKAAHTGLKP